MLKRKTVTRMPIYNASLWLIVVLIAPRSGACWLRCVAPSIYVTDGYSPCHRQRGVNCSSRCTFKAVAQYQHWLIAIILFQRSISMQTPVTQSLTGNPSVLECKPRFNPTTFLNLYRIMFHFGLRLRYTLS